MRAVLAVCVFVGRASWRWNTWERECVVALVPNSCSVGGVWVSGRGCGGLDCLVHGFDKRDLFGRVD